jgi:hypothetical protein
MRIEDVDRGDDRVRRYSPGDAPVHFLNARWNALGSAKPSSKAISVTLFSESLR